MSVHGCWSLLPGFVISLATVASGEEIPPAASWQVDQTAKPPSPPVTRRKVFRIQVVDEATGRGVPLVELRTVNQIRYVTDSNGVAAFDEPGLFNRKVFFFVTSHGYEAAKDNFGYRGRGVEVTEGGSARIGVLRLNIAERLYRITGAGIYRDSTLTGDRIPIREPLLNGLVFGQDSVINALYRDRIHWFWGDTNRPDYPLGNFHVPGATSERPGQWGLDPDQGIDLSYFLDEKGFAKPTAPIPGDGPTWLSGLVVLNDRERRERMFAYYAKIRNQLEVYQHGLVEYRPEIQRFEKVIQFPDARLFPGDFPSGHPFLFRDRGVDYVYFANPFPLIRVPADPEKLGDLRSFESFTALKPGTTRTQQQLDSGPDGSPRYGWKRQTQVLPQDQQNKLISAGRIRTHEALLNLQDVETSKAVLAHGGSVYWNAFRGRWVMIAVESFGSTSYLGEVWYAEADTPLGPWVYARKVVTHDKYSFYNPKQHPMFDKDGGRFIYFEGTYTTTFSGNPDPTPRYDYNQVMYRLDLSDRRLSLPVAIHESSKDRGSIRLVSRKGVAESVGAAPGPIAFFAPDRPGNGTLPVYEQIEDAGQQTLHVESTKPPAAGKVGGPLFFLLPDDNMKQSPATIRLYEYTGASGRHTYSIHPPGTAGRPTTGARVLGRVWKNPGRSRPW